MRKRTALTACALALSVSPLLGGCASNTGSGSADAEKGGAPAESSQPAADAEGEEAAESQQEAQAKPKVDYKDGTYTGEGKGAHGTVSVTLTVADGVITVDEVMADAETEGIGGKEAAEDGTFKAQIEAAQGSDIDGVTGATLTSGGVSKAVDAALAQAK